MKLHHVGMAVPSIARQVEHYREALGVELTSEIIEDEAQKVRVAFAEVAEGVFLEFVEPLGADSPITQILERGGSRLYHLCYEVPDLASAVERVCRAGGIAVTSPTPARAFGGRPIAFVYTRDRSLIEFLQE